MKIILDVYEPMIYSGTGDSIVDINKGDYPHISPTLGQVRGSTSYIFCIRRVLCHG